MHAARHVDGCGSDGQWNQCEPVAPLGAGSRDASPQRVARSVADAQAPSGRRSCPCCLVPMQLPAKVAAADIRIELRRGATLISVTWPIDSAGECASWVRELLR